MKKLFKNRFPVVRQYDRVDCGPAALLSVLKYYGGNASLVYLRELCNVNTQGTTMLEIVNAAKTLGFNAYGAAGEYEDLLNENMPCIAHVVVENGLNHFIIVYRIDEKGIVAGDPGKGICKLSKAEFEKIWKKKAVILLKPGNDLYNYKPPNWFNWITSYLKEQESWVIQTLFLGIVYTVLGLLTSVFVRLLIDKFIPDKNYVKIIYTGALLFFLLSVRSLAGYFRQRFLVVLNKKINININKDFLAHIFQLPKKFFDTRKIGDITARINDSMRIQQAILLITNTTIIDGLIILSSFLFMFYFSPVLAWVSVFTVPIYTFILFSRTKTIKDEQNDVMKGYSLVESSYIDSLKGIDDVLGFCVSDKFSLNNIGLFGYFQDRIEKLGLTQAKLSFFADISGSVLTAFILIFGAVYVIKDKLMLGQMMASYSLLAGILPSINRFVGANISLQGANIAAQRLRDILLVEKERNGGKLQFKIEEKLTILNGAFSWPRSKPLLKGVTLSVEKGRLISMWGRSGTGKSTLVQIIQRKYSLSDGQVLVDNVPADKFDLFEYRKSIGVVPQEIKIFNGTIVDNITMGREIKNYDEIIRKIESLGLGTFISRFEYGLLTPIGEEGRKLSGGEMQMLALIRALYDLPEVLIIDEGFSGMDIEVENTIFTALRKYAENHAVMIITHNLRTISKTDYIYILEHGVITEQGKPEELLSNSDSHYNKLVNLQKVKLRAE